MSLFDRAHDMSDDFPDVTLPWALAIMFRGIATKNPLCLPTAE